MARNGTKKCNALLLLGCLSLLQTGSGEDELDLCGGLGYDPPLCNVSTPISYVRKPFALSYLLFLSLSRGSPFSSSIFLCTSQYERAR